MQNRYCFFNNKVINNEIRMQRANQLLHSLRGALSSAKKDTFTQKDIAALLGVNEPTMSRWFTGKIKLGQIELLLRFIEHLPEERWQREISDALNRRAGVRYRRSNPPLRKKANERRKR
ncbi:MAG: hypothetical protein KF715_15965 [Candidatus Didemnitutus sp.]|nr:hypothetical protein [Candidatus Didemnitutus sp.]